MVVIVASLFAGMVTADSSSQSHLRKRMPLVSGISSCSIDLKPIDRPGTRPALINAQARSISAVTPLAILAMISMPALPTLACVTWPIGLLASCCHSSGIGSLNCAPIGSTTSFRRSGAGVVAMPVMVRASSSTCLISSRL